MYIRDIFWNTFESSGSIDAYMAYKEVQRFTQDNADQLSTESKAWCG